MYTVQCTTPPVCTHTVWTHQYARTHTNICPLTHEHTHPPTYTHTHARLHARTLTCTHARTHLMDTHTHTNPHGCG